MKIKSSITAAITAGFVISAAFTCFAGEWKSDANGSWYQDDNGNYPVNQWKIIEGKWYYFNEFGYMVSNAWIGNYYLGSDGAMLTNTITPDGYKVGANGAWIQDANIRDVYNRKISELKIEEDNTGVHPDFTVIDLNSDGIDELFAFDTIGYARAWRYENGKAIELEMPKSLLRATWLHDKLLCSTDYGHSSHTSDLFYRLNDRYEFEFIVGLKWTNGAWNGLGRDAYYITDEYTNEIKEITEKEYDTMIIE